MTSYFEQLESLIRGPSWWNSTGIKTHPCEGRLPSLWLAVGRLVSPWESWSILQGLSGCRIELLRISDEGNTNISNVSCSRDHKCANSNHKYLGIEVEI